MRKLFLLASFLVIAPLFLILNIVLLLNISRHKQSTGLVPMTRIQTVAYAALPTQNTYGIEINQKDSRIEAVREFFARYSSPLEPLAQDVVQAADANEIDYRLIPAIAMQESNLCKKTPKNSFNCWGFGIYGGRVRKFENYKEGVELVTKTLAKYYKGSGLESPEEIMTKYTPSNDGAWARSVSHFMDQIQ